VKQFSMDLSIIFVNWNSLDYLEKSARSIYQYTTGVTLEVIVVDNASTHDDLTTFEREFPAARVIRNPQNVGFAAANNIGFAVSTGDCVLLLNPDTELYEPSINTMLKYLRQLPDAGIIGCKLLNSDGTVQISSIQRFPTVLNQVIDVEYLRLRWPHCPLWKIGPLFAANISALPVEVIPGACMLLRREVFAKVGMLTEDYFMYAEDLDLNYKLRIAGLKSYYVGETAIIHHGGRSSARQTVSHWSRLMQCRAMKRYFRKTRGALYEGIYQAAVGVVALMRVVVVILIGLVLRKPGMRANLAGARHKWWAVFQWSLGMRVVKADESSSGV
jgi:GT2 family glycosyltransferase